MDGRNYDVVVLDELERYPAMSGAPVLMPLRRRLEVSAFGINCWTAPVGALTGNADAAFEHLARALALGPPRVRQLAASGEDFAGLRSDPRWEQLIE